MKAKLNHLGTPARLQYLKGLYTNLAVENYTQVIFSKYIQVTLNHTLFLERQAAT